MLELWTIGYQQLQNWKPETDVNKRADCEKFITEAKVRIRL